MMNIVNVFVLMYHIFTMDVRKEIAQFTVVAIVFIDQLIGSLAASPSGTATLSLEYRSLSSSQATLQWAGADISTIKFCQVSYTNETESVSQWSIQPIPYSNYSFILSPLDAETTYQVFLECKDFEEMQHLSKILTFTTVAEGMPSITQFDIVVTTPKYTPNHPLSNGELKPASKVPPVTREKMTPASSPTEVALGVILGIAGMGVTCTVAYFFLRKYRRQRRIQRLLQYRQQDSDPFSDAEDDGDMA